MKKILLLFGGSLTATVFLLAVLLAVRERVPDLVGMAPTLSEVTCPFLYTLDGGAQAKADALSVWTIFVSDFHNTAPKVNVSHDTTTAASDSSKGACTIEIVRVPGRPLKGVDWRMGTMQDPAPARGKNATVSIKLRADKEIAFDAGQIYLYDGKQITGTPLGILNTEWKTFTFEHLVSIDANVLEVWLRLTIHGKISQKGTVQMADAKLTVD